MGNNDLLKELNAVQRPDRLPLMLALQNTLLAGRAHGLSLLDGVYNAISDQAGFEAECEQGRDLGFDGKTLIHPSQVDAANRKFAPSAEEIEKSRRIIDAFDQAMAQGKGVVQLDGKMIENLHVDHARRVLAFAEILVGNAP
jgi:citrate lyase beta subunit